MTGAAIWIEAISDAQLRGFRNTNPPAGTILKSGLWAYSRHPNYFGEILFWWGLYLFGLAAEPTMWWTIIGPSAITLLFVFISVPMIDKRSLVRRPGYTEHMMTTSAIVPWPNRGAK